MPETLPVPTILAPAAISPWARLQDFYRRMLVQRVIVLMVLAAAAYLQYYLVNVPIADLSQTTKFSPATVKASEQIVSFKNPETDAGAFAFGFEQTAESLKQRMAVDAYFDQASLSEETLHKLSALGVQAPAGAAAISYQTSDDDHGDSPAGGHANVRCKTAVQLQTNFGQTENTQVTASHQQARAAEFWQSASASSDRHRLLEMKMSGMDSTATLSSQGTFGEAILSSSSCKVTLHVGVWQQVMGGFIPVVVRIPAGSSCRLRWEEADIQPTGWNTVGTPLSLLTFGRAQRQSFHAEEIGVYPAQTPEKDRARTGLVARSEHKDGPLTVDSMMIGTDHFQFGASGKGRVRENGSAVVTANLLETINKYPLIAALFGAANLGLLNWAKRRFFPPSRATPAALVPFPRVDGKNPTLQSDNKAGSEDKAASG